jgi:hypothetical protein
MAAILEKLRETLSAPTHRRLLTLLEQQGPLAVPTGIPDLDRALAYAGFPRSRITEVSGTLAGGVQTVLHHAVAAASASGSSAVVMDPRGCWYPPALLRLKARFAHILWMQPCSEKELLWFTEAALAENADLVVVDAPGPMLSNKTIQRLETKAGKANSALVFATRIGGRLPQALPYAASLRLEVSRQAAAWNSSLWVVIRKQRGPTPQAAFPIQLPHTQGDTDATPGLHILPPPALAVLPQGAPRRAQTGALLLTPAARTHARGG